MAEAEVATPAGADGDYVWAIAEDIEQHVTAAKRFSRALWENLPKIEDEALRQKARHGVLMADIGIYRLEQAIRKLYMAGAS